MNTELRAEKQSQSSWVSKDGGYSLPKLSKISEREEGMEKRKEGKKEGRERKEQNRQTERKREKIFMD